MSHKIRQTLPLLVVALSLVAACGDTKTAPREVNATLKTFSIILSSNTAKAGDITFHIKSEATDVAHEFVIVKTDLASDKLPLDAEGHKVQEDKISPVDEMEDIDPGKGGDLKVNLSAGHYVLLCNIPDHYKAGMRADFTVVQ